MKIIIQLIAICSLVAGGGVTVLGLSGLSQSEATTTIYGVGAVLVGAFLIAFADASRGTTSGWKHTTTNLLSLGAMSGTAVLALSIMHIYRAKFDSPDPVGSIERFPGHSITIPDEKRGQISLGELFSVFEESLDAESKLPLPLPTPSKHFMLNREGFGSPNDSLLVVFKSIQKKLQSAGLSGAMFKYVPYGFALVTRIQEIDDDGSAVRTQPKDGSRALTFSGAASAIFGYGQSIFLKPEGRHRVFVVVVTPTDLPVTEDPGLKANRVAAWSRSGRLTAPQIYDSVPFLSAFTVTLLVYEFRFVGRNADSQLVPDSTISDQDHLAASGLQGSASARNQPK